MKTLDEKRAEAIAYLGERHVLHKQFVGGVSHDAQSVNVGKTIKRYNKRVADEQKRTQERLQSIMQNVRPIGRMK